MHMPGTEFTSLSEEARFRLFQLREIPPPSTMAREVLRIAGDDYVDLEEVAGLIEKSPELTARVLRCANSAYYGHRRRVNSAQEAIIRVLGLSVTKGLILALSLASPFQVRACGGFRYDRHWFISMVTAILARDLAGSLQLTGKLSPGEAYTAGLIHNLGMLAMVHAFPEEISEILDEAEPFGMAARMQDRLGLNHYLAGGWLARYWGLPEDLVRVIAHCREEDYQGPNAPLVRLIGGAADLAEGLFAGGEIGHLPPAWSGGLIPADDAEEVLREVAGQVPDLMGLASQLAGG